MWITFLKHSIQYLFKTFGLDLSRYHPETNKWFVQKKLLENVVSPVILDVGANIGQTLKVYKSLFPDGEIHCFEPFPDSYNILKDFATQFNRSQTYQLAIAEKTEETVFHVNSDYHATNSLFYRPSKGYCYYPKEAQLNDTIPVKTDTLDSFAQRINLNQVNILKMDIQGAELLALRGATQLLENQAISLIVTEVMFVPHYEGGALFNQIHDFLSTKDYSLFGIYDAHFAENCQIRFADAIFISRDLRAQLK
ncbi:MAG: FkbM family methyltransferase [Bacteroidetes bacterium]|nr:FkbM family methyltransferase [Bacteroidota bacterium]